MRLVEMRPEQVRDAVDRNVPVLMAAGVVEYHGPHLPIGTDALIARSVCEAVEKRCECVLAPPLSLGPTGSWAGGPADGELDVPCEPFFQYAKATLRGLLDMGFERIYVLQHHQGAEGGQALSLKRAAYECWAEDGREAGPGWGRVPNERDEEPFPRNRVTVAGIGSFLPEDVGPVPVGHAGEGETQLIMATLPETVRMDALPEEAERPRWLYDAEAATPEDGEHWFETVVDSWVAELRDEG